MLFEPPPSQSLSDLMEKPKTNSAKRVHEHWPGRRSFGWQTGCTGFSVSQSTLERVRQYIFKQELHHGKITYREGVLALLQKHGIQYDPRFGLE